jgi:hypothetical protein
MFCFASISGDSFFSFFFWWLPARLKKLEQQVDSLLVRVERTVSLAPGNWLDGREVGGYPMPHSSCSFSIFTVQFVVSNFVFFFFGVFNSWRVII